MMQDYETELVKNVVDAVKVPVFAIGGASGVKDLKIVLEDGHPHAVARCSVSVYYGKLKAVLFTVPREEESFCEGIYKA